MKIDKNRMDNKMKFVPGGLTPSQQKAWDILNDSKRNCFISGKAGSGKTFLLKEWLSRKTSTQTIKVIASTGMAAVNIGGCTFHSFFGLGCCTGTDAEIIKSVYKRGDKLSRIRKIKTIVIDEISMISGRLFGLANTVCQIAKSNRLPFGGIKMVVVGDFSQLPPISETNEIDWVFKSKIWKDCNFENIMLMEPVRTNNLEFLEILDKVRYGCVDEKVRNYIFSKKIESDKIDDFKGTRIFSTRHKVDVYNQARLNEIQSKQYTFNTKFSGDDKYFQALKNSIPISETINLKIGALVMTRVNGADLLYVNGSLGIITNIDESNEIIDINLLDENGTSVSIKPKCFEWIVDDKVKATARNYPLTLAWAVTSHKIQGASLKHLLIDLSYLWEYGQAYVLLSRSSDPNNLRILNPNTECIKSDPQVIKFYDDILKGL